MKNPVIKAAVYTAVFTLLLSIYHKKINCAKKTAGCANRN